MKLRRSSASSPTAAAVETFATGLRNTIGFGWHPESKAMWGMGHNTDWLGDDFPAEELLEKGKHYGWPFEVVRVDFDGDAPARIVPFLTGFVIDGGAATFGRPTGVAVARDGALLVGDDETGVVYRIARAGS